MTVTIRCSCGASFTVDDEQPAVASEPDNSPGDVTTQAHHHGWTETNLGFTTPALEG